MCSSGGDGAAASSSSQKLESCLFPFLGIASAFIASSMQALMNCHGFSGRCVRSTLDRVCVGLDGEEATLLSAIQARHNSNAEALIMRYGSESD